MTAYASWRQQVATPQLRNYEQFLYSGLVVCFLPGVYVSQMQMQMCHRCRCRWILRKIA